MRKVIALAGLVIGCGPIVPFDDGTDASSSSTQAGSETGAEVDDGRPDPSQPDPSVDPDPSAGESAPDTSATASSTGPMLPTCGDGVLDPGEACDDGNEDDGDDCTSTCSLPVAIEWTATYDGPSSSFDVANDVAIAADGSIWLAGKSRQASDDVLLQQYAPDGVLLWTFTWDGAEALADTAEALAPTPDGRIAIVGTTESMATGDDVLVLLVDPPTGAVLWTQVIDGPGSGAGEYDEVDGGDDIAVDPAGNLVVAGTMRVGAGEYDAWVGELEPLAGELRWAEGWSASAYDDAQAVAVMASGDVALLVEHEEGRRATTVFYDDDGASLGIAIEHPFGAHDLARRADGSLAVVGIDDEGYDPELVVAAYDDGFNPWWTDVDEGDDNDDWLGVAGGPSAEAAAVGTRGASGQQGNGRILVYAEDGTPLWGASHDGPASLEDAFHAAAFDATGAVIAVGFENVLGQQSNVLVRKYVAG